jgi:hypothetical protein
MGWEVVVVPVFLCFCSWIDMNLLRERSHFKALNSEWPPK